MSEADILDNEIQWTSNPTRFRDVGNAHLQLKQAVIYFEDAVESVPLRPAHADFLSIHSYYLVY